MIVVIVLLVGVIGGVAFMKMKHGKKGKKVEDLGPKSEIALGEMFVNLADTDQMRYLKTDIVLELRGEMKSEGGGHGEGEAKPPAAIRDAVISTLSSRTFMDLIKPEGREKLKEEICEAVTERISEENKAKCTEVYFNEFAMQ